MIPHFENYIKENITLLGEVLFYQLILEALLTEIIKRNANAPSESKLKSYMFSKKATECLNMGKLSLPLHGAVLALNRVRNRYAHEFGFEISFEDALALAKICGEAGVEFSDDLSEYTVEQAIEMGYDTLGILNEAFRNTFFEVAYYQNDEQFLEFIA